MLQYGTSVAANPRGEGLPVLRMNNLQDSGWDLTDLKYVELPPKEAEAYRLEPGDILFNRTNSKELVGKCAVFREQGYWVFASYLIRMKLKKDKALPDFVSGFLDTQAGRAQIDRVSRQIIGMSNINAEEIRALKIPLPPLETQDVLVAELMASQQARDKKLARAEALLAGFDEYLLDKLGLAPLTEENRASFAVRLNQVSGGRIDPPAYRPFYAEGELPKTPTRPLREVAKINANKVALQIDEDTLVPYVGLPECDLTRIREVTTRLYGQVKNQSVFEQGDILFARIEPSVFNKKYILADNLLGHDYAFTSTEFYVVRAEKDRLEQDYLYAMFSCSFVFAQVRGKTTGSSGRRRIDSELFGSLQIPVPDRSVQREIAVEMRRRREESRKLRTEAQASWETAKAKFERKLLGEKSGR